MRICLGASALIVAALYAVPAFAADPAIVCESSKLKTIGKYFGCRLKEDAKAAKTATNADYAKCESKFNDKYVGAETKAGADVCPTEGNVSTVKNCVAQAATECAALAQPGCTDQPCAECQDCVQQPGEECGPYFLACWINVDCHALMVCHNACGDESCVQACYDDYPAGQPVYDAIGSCIVAECADPCM